MSDRRDGLDPEMGAAIDAIRDQGFEGWSTYSVERARVVEDELFSAGSGPAMDAVRDVTVDGPDGEVPVRAYRPPVANATAGSAGSGDRDPLPTLVFYHGGGFVLGTLDSADDVCRVLARRTGSVVLSVDYRLAPEHPFPAAVEDAVAALRWAGESAEEFGGDPDRLSVAGTSAGGCLAAASALWAREAGIDLACQVLLYPMLDPELSRPSVAEHADRPLLSRADLRWFWDLYLPEAADRRDPSAAPLNADPEGVAPAVVAIAGYDPLGDEGRDYADLLSDAGVPVETLHFPTLGHGFASLTDRVGRADEAVDEVAAAVAGIRDDATERQ